MSSVKDIQKEENEQRLQKAKNKVIDALEKDPLGLSIAQLMTICQLSIKTVKNVLAVIDVDQEDGVFFLKGKPKAEIGNPEHELALRFFKVAQKELDSNTFNRIKEKAKVA